MQRIPLLVDDRESQSAVMDVLRQHPEIDVCVSRLRLGDYLADGRFLFERKTLRDLVSSIASGRLFSQALRLARSPHRPALILEGTSQDLACYEMSWEAIQGAIVMVTLFCGIPILRSRTPEETVRTILYAARQGRRYTNGALPRPGHRPSGKLARQLFILQGLPGIGPDRARRLLKRFGSVVDVVNASREELRLVEGIGRIVATNIRWAVEEPS